VLAGELVPAGFDCFKRWYFRLFDELAKPFPAALDALVAARERGKRVGVFTGKARATALYSLDRLGVADAVECIASEDDYEKPKPHHGGLLKIMADLDLPAGRIFYVGDQLSDLQAGQAAGVITGGALWAPYATAATDGRRPDVSFETPESCLQFINGF
jgi:HAD superfamily hydrolase (TIGR01549 family)